MKVRRRCRPGTYNLKLVTRSRLTEKLGAYAEQFGFSPNAEGSDSAHALNGSLTWLIGNNFQIDVRVGAGLNEEVRDFLAGVGFAWRYGTFRFEV